MCIEELEIIVTAKVEEVVREVMKLAPQIKQAMKQAQEAFEKVDTKKMQSKFQQAVQFMKKKIQDIKKSTQSSEIAIKVNNKDAQKQISQVQKQIESLQEKINARQMKLKVITPRLDEITSKTTKAVTPNGVSPNNPAIQKTINNSLFQNKEYSSLIAQEEKMTQEITMYTQQLNEAKNKMTELKQETNQTAITQNKLSSFFIALKPVFHNITSQCQKISKSFLNLINPLNYIKKIARNISNKIKGMGTGMKQNLGHILKYASALFSLRGIYSILSSCAQSWLSSQNAGAKQLSTNIDYLKNSLGSVLAPAIQWITNLIYQLMKAIQSVVYALFKVNIFANASAKSYGAMAGNAKKAKEETKQLAGIHDELNNVSSNDNSDSGSANGGTVAPSFDLSSIDSQLSPLAQKLYDFFKPLKESWDNYGSRLIEQVRTTAGQVAGLIVSVWGSFENIITNGTVYTSLELILAIIGNIAEAFSNAWNYNNNGDAIVQNLANAFNNLLGAINNVVQSEGFQSWLNWCSDKFREISEKIASINWQPLLDALMKIGTTVGSIALEILSGLIDIFKWLVENPDIAVILIAIAGAITLVVKAISTISTISTIIKSVSELAEVLKTTVSTIISTIGGVALVVVGVVASISSFISMLSEGFSWIKEIIMLVGIAIAAVGAVILGVPAAVAGVVAAVVAVVATLVVIIKEHWEEIKEFFANLWQGICDIFSNVGQWFSDRFTEAYNFIVGIFQGIGQWFSDRWNDICNIFSGVGQWFSDRFNEAVEGIKNIFNNIGAFFSGVWQGICNIFGNVSGWFKDKFSQAWEAVKNVFSKGGAIFSGIKDGILNGLKTVINAIINGINKVIAIPFNGINTALRSIKSVNILGLQPFSWINTIGVPQIPTLAKGGVLYDDTIVRAGEYSGASTNPEIVTPQNIMYDTMKKALSESDIGNNNDRPIYLTVNVSNKKLGQILLEDLRNMKRQTGNGLEALVGG